MRGPRPQIDKDVEARHSLFSSPRASAVVDEEPIIEQPGVLLDLSITESEMIAELEMHAEGRPRDEYALAALRIGLLALKQARGCVDADLVQRECERLLTSMDARLREHTQQVHERVTGSLKEYFDPNSGRLQERIERLVRQDGELESVLRRQIGHDDSQLARTLALHVGEQSPLMRLLNPSESQGVVRALGDTLDAALQEQRERVLREFSLDNKEGALCRLVEELAQTHGKLSGRLEEKLGEVVKEFSLDQENSALSRLVRNVERAQRTITSEFSLDNEQSALTRMFKALETTNQAIHNQLTLDDDSSALSRLKRELLDLLQRHSDSNAKFQEHVRVTLAEMSAKKAESERSTRHGDVFETEVFSFLQRESQRVGDVIERTGATTGLIKNCKKGDLVVELGPESSAAGARIAVEAKQDAGFSLAKAREEVEEARKNRGAGVGLFVFSRRIAPEGLDSFLRYGSDVFVVWDAEDERSDLYLRAGFSLCRALCARDRIQRQVESVDFESIDQAVLEIEKRSASLDDVSKAAESIRSSSDKILDRIRITRAALERQVRALNERLGELRSTIGGAANDATH